MYQDLSTLTGQILHMYKKSLNVIWTYLGSSTNNNRYDLAYSSGGNNFNLSFCNLLDLTKKVHEHCCKISSIIHSLYQSFTNYNSFLFVCSSSPWWHPKGTKLGMQMMSRRFWERFCWVCGGVGIVGRVGLVVIVNVVRLNPLPIVFNHTLWHQLWKKK